MPQMDLPDLIKRYGELKDESNDRYFSGLIDFFKWTTTFAFAVVIWIGTNSKNQIFGSNWLLASIIFIIVSIIIALITTYLILDYWNRLRDFNSKMHLLLVNSDVKEKHPTHIMEEELDRHRKLVLDSASIIFEFKRFDGHLILHLVVLFIGIICYLCAIYF